MSSSWLLLLENEREADATLQDALAFIDAFEDESEATDAPAVKRIKSIKKPHSERVKLEIERLRNDAEALEATLNRMKQSSAAQARKKIQTVARGSPNTTAQFDSHSSAAACAIDGWIKIIVDEFRLRRQAEATNRQLKVHLDEQTKCIQASQAALSFQFTKEELNVMYGSQQSMAQYEGIATEQSLTARVQQLFLDVDHMLVRSGLLNTSSPLSRSQRKVDTLGVYYEATCCSSVPCSVEATNQAFWKQVMGKTKVNGDVFDERYSETFQVEFNQQTFEIRSKASMRSRSEADRVIYIWSSLSTLPSHHWAFVEDSIIVLRKAQPLVAHGTLIQTWYRVKVKENGVPCSMDPLKESIMSSLSTRVQTHILDFSNAISDVTAITAC